MQDIINITFGTLMASLDDEVVRAVQKVGIDVNKEELLKALELYRHLVRCKECKFSESVITSWSTDGKNNVVERLCKVHKWSVKDDDYCSYGEREGE